MTVHFPTQVYYYLANLPQVETVGWVRFFWLVFFFLVVVFAIDLHLNANYGWHH